MFPCTHPFQSWPLLHHGLKHPKMKRRPRCFHRGRFLPCEMLLSELGYRGSQGLESRLGWLGHLSLWVYTRRSLFLLRIVIVWYWPRELGWARESWLFFPHMVSWPVSATPRSGLILRPHAKIASTVWMSRQIVAFFNHLWMGMPWALSVYLSYDHPANGMILANVNMNVYTYIYIYICICSNTL